MSDSTHGFDLAAALSGRRLLEHPFYRRWERGEISRPELAAYASQYRHFERYLPDFLSQLVAALPEGTARDLIAANLADELGDPIPHVELFEGFASAVGASPDDVSPATRNLIGMFEELLAIGPLPALAGFVAYESQSSEVAERKAEGLRCHYGLDGDGVSFWEHHATVDTRHGEWAVQALEQACEDPTVLVSFAKRSADAWWSFLDERLELAPSA